MGGYFVCNGIERLIRLLVQTRRHYVMALRRGAYHKRGANYTDAATLVRWARCALAGALRAGRRDACCQARCMLPGALHAARRALLAHAARGGWGRWLAGRAGGSWLGGAVRTPRRLAGASKHPAGAAPPAGGAALMMNNYDGS